MSASVFIQTLNEQQNLPRCLASVSWSDDIVVLDSLSSDGTFDIAREAGARVFQRKYEGRANNQNWAVENIQFKHPWVWHTDADEVTPPELAEEIEKVTSETSRSETVYYVRPKNMLFGKWLKHGGQSNVWIARLWRPDKIRWERTANPIARIDGPIGYLENYFIHHLFSRGFHGWFDRHNRSSTYEAHENIKAIDTGSIDWRGLVSRYPRRRRDALRRLSYHLPARPMALFTYMYFFKGGILDGKAGFTIAMLKAMYEYEICLKVSELRRKEKGLSV
jgi:glycosyltransferase involved in cell wall biosynthesis